MQNVCVGGGGGAEGDGLRIVCLSPPPPPLVRVHSTNVVGNVKAQDTKYCILWTFDLSMVIQLCHVIFGPPKYSFPLEPIFQLSLEINDSP